MNGIDYFASFAFRQDANDTDDFQTERMSRFWGGGVVNEHVIGMKFQGEDDGLAFAWVESELQHLDAVKVVRLAEDEKRLGNEVKRGKSPAGG